MVYVIQLPGGPDGPVSVDGKWMGATVRKSYFFFPVDPGEHRVCSMLVTLVDKDRFFASFHAAAGKAYYFLQTREAKWGHWVLVQADPDEAKLLISESRLATTDMR
jgi:hypothetical protein